MAKAGETSFLPKKAQKVSNCSQKLRLEEYDINLIKFCNFERKRKHIEMNIGNFQARS